MTNTHLFTITFIITLLYHILYLFTSDNMPYEKVGDNDPICIADEVPFEIPNGWEWCRLDTISYMVGNKYNQIKTSEIKKNGEIPVVSQGQSLIDGFSNEKSKTIKDVPLIMFGDHTKNIKYIDFPFVIAADGTKFHKIILCNDKYIYYWMIYITINIVDRGYARHHSLLLQEFIPLPPFQEQQRIVSEIEKYLPLINEYDKLQTELDTLDKEFPEKLKKSILQQAIKGKLVEQDKSEEPASVLLEKIRKEKEKLIKEGKIKKDKNESIIYKRDNSYYEKLNGVEKCIDDEIPFEIPESWEWCRLGYLAQYKKGPFGSSLTKSMFIKKSKDAIKVYEQKNAIYKNNTIGDYYISKEYFKSKLSAFEVKPNEIIVSCAGTIGETYVLPNNIEKGIINQALMLINLYDKSITQYYLLYFKTIIKHNAIKQSNGSAIKNIPPFEILKNYLFPLPPLNEQNRIINAVNQLLNTLIIK